MECNFCNDEENYCNCYWNKNKCEINEKIYEQELLNQILIQNIIIKVNQYIEKYCGNIPSFFKKLFLFLFLN